MSYTVTQESFDSLASYWSDPGYGLDWNSVFVLPAWLKVWWREFGSGNELYLSAVRQSNEIIGIAPLLLRKGEASIVGSPDVCDYLDFVVVPDRERDFFNVLLDELSHRGINHLDLKPLRPDSTVLTSLSDVAQTRGCQVLTSPEDVSLELDLPATWEEYLGSLTGKQRHELKRKLRRLGEAGEANYRSVKDVPGVQRTLDTFLKMFTESRQDKATFMTAPMESFFRSLADTMARAGLLRLGILELDGLPTAMIMFFDYNGCIYLYNSGYDARYSSLSAGLLCKVLSIRESIQEGKKRFDLLKGDETYKYHLGGREVPLYSCQISLKL